jgi:chaperone modulatory protein CbpM
MTLPATALARCPYLSLDAFARAVDLHPELVVRLVALGVIDATRRPTGELQFAPDQIPAAARLQRLRAGLAVNYAALGLIADLLDRIAQLERELRRRPVVDVRPEVRSWS